MKIEIYFRDLNEEKQKEILRHFGYSNEAECNRDIFPLFILECEGGDKNE